jgi:hypothetical protein
MFSLNKIGAIVCWMIFGIMAFSGVSYAQSQQEVKLWVSDFRGKTRDLDGISENLNAMKKSAIINDVEFRAIDSTFMYLKYIDAFSTGILQLAYIYDYVSDSRDVSYVRQHFYVACGNLKSTTSSTRSAINQTMLVNLNPTIRAEIIRARDSLLLVQSGLPC